MQREKNSKRDRQTDRYSILLFTHQMPATAEVRWDKAWSHELRLGLSHGLQAPSHLDPSVPTQIVNW